MIRISIAVVIAFNYRLTFLECRCIVRLWATYIADASQLLEDEGNVQACKVKLNGLTQKRVTDSSRLNKAATFSFISPQSNPKASKRSKKANRSNSTSLKALAVHKLQT